MLNRAILITHPDWPWCFEPEEIHPRTLKTCLETLQNIHQLALKAKIAGTEICLFKTPDLYVNHPLPRKAKPLVADIEAAASKILVDAHHLETNAAAVAKNSNAKFWIVAGFWKELCCSDCKYGILSIPGKKALIPHNLSTESGI